MTAHEAIFLSGAESHRKGLPLMCAPRVLPGLSRETVREEWQRGWKAARDARAAMLADMAREAGFTDLQLQRWAA